MIELVNALSASFNSCDVKPYAQVAEPRRVASNHSTAQIWISSAHNLRPRMRLTAPLCKTKEAAYEPSFTPLLIHITSKNLGGSYLKLKSKEVLFLDSKGSKAFVGLKGFFFLRLGTFSDGGGEFVDSAGISLCCGSFGLGMSLVEGMSVRYWSGWLRSIIFQY